MLGHSFKKPIKESHCLAKMYIETFFIIYSSPVKTACKISALFYSRQTGNDLFVSIIQIQAAKKTRRLLSYRPTAIVVLWNASVKGCGKRHVQVKQIFFDAGAHIQDILPWVIYDNNRITTSKRLAEMRSSQTTKRRRFSTRNKRKRPGIPRFAAFLFVINRKLAATKTSLHCWKRMLQD